MSDFVTQKLTDGSERVLLTRLTDGRVMCCLCFEYTKQEDLNVRDDGSAEDVCKPCAEVEAARRSVQQYTLDRERLLARGVKDLNADEMRRVAELTEFLVGEKEARPWWAAAAKAGDQSAIGSVAELGISLEEAETAG
jgi:hypothetical protein